MSNHLQKTPIHAWHMENRANMADFGGYEMPLWYSSAKNEHLAVIETAGMFDTSHMATLRVGGPGAFDLLQYCFTQDLTQCVAGGKKPLSPGRCVYGAFLNEKGEVIDDSIINQLGDTDYMLVVNAGMGPEVARHLENQSRNVAAHVHILDLTDKLGKMDVQGPNAAKIMEKALAGADQAFARMPYFSFRGHLDFDKAENVVKLNDGTPVLLSRTGYTGEFGFEIFTAAGDILAVWEKIYAAGADLGLVPCGLAARDSLRAGAVLPLSHQDIGAWPFLNHPWEFALPFARDSRDFTKSFLGADALKNIETPLYTRPFTGFDLRKVSLPATVETEDGTEIGRVLTCVTDMAIGRDGETIYSIASREKPENFKARGLCCGFVHISQPLTTGEVLFLKDQRRRIKVVLTDNIRPDRTARRPLADMR